MVVATALAGPGVTARTTGNGGRGTVLALIPLTRNIKATLDPAATRAVVGMEAMAEGTTVATSTEIKATSTTEKSMATRVAISGNNHMRRRAT